MFSFLLLLCFGVHVSRKHNRTDAGMNLDFSNRMEIYIYFRLCARISQTQPKGGRNESRLFKSDGKIGISVFFHRRDTRVLAKAF